VLESRLDGVPEEFADYVFQMREDVGECCGEVTSEVYGWEGDALGSEKGCYFGAASGDDFGGAAA